MAADGPIRLKGNYFADPEFFRTDVTKGVTRTPAGTRVCTLPSDFLLGFRDAVIYECGRSYRAVLKAAGRRWGTQFAKRLERELTAFYQSPFRQLPAALVRVCLADAFAAHGYGRLTVAPLAEDPEFAVAEVRDPVMPALVREADRPVDALAAGMLGAVFAHLGGKPLDAVQTDCPSLGADRSRFLIGPAPRVAEIEEWLDGSDPLPGHEAVARRLARVPRAAPDEPAAVTPAPAPPVTA
jgi:predicted hydrocarbon binding protein